MPLAWDEPPKGLPQNVSRTALESNYAPTSRRAPGLEGSAESTLLVGQIGPPLLAAVVAQLAGRVETTGLSTGHDCWRVTMLERL